MHSKRSLLLDPRAEGGPTVTSPALPEPMTEGDTIEEAPENVKDALAAILELDEDLGRSPPPGPIAPGSSEPVRAEPLAPAP